MGIITEATVRVSALPQREDFHAVFFPDFAAGMAAVRRIIQAGLPLSMLRLSTAVETTTTLALAGHERLIGALEKLLTWRGAGDEKAMLMFGVTGRDDLVKSGRKAALHLAKEQGGVHVGKTFGRRWQKSRFQTPYLRNTLWEMGYAIDTLETAVPWSQVPAMRRAIENALHTALDDAGERVHVFTHLSHMYSDGASIYTTYLFRLAPEPEATLARWQALKTAASQAIIDHRGTISHQHGVGVDHAPYLPAEKGELGMAALREATAAFDPEGMMNPGKLFSG
jgi:alkyldihydroxyacetonephosphate synthase